MKKIHFTLIFRLLVIGLLVNSPAITAQIFDQGMSHTAGPNEGSATCVRYNSDGKIMVAGTEKGKITVRYLTYISKTRPRTIPKILRGHTAPITDISIHQNNDFLASTSKDGTLKIWNIKERKVVFTAAAKPRNGNPNEKPHFIFAHFSVVSPNTLFYGSSDGQLYQTDIFKGGVKASANTRKESMSSFTFGKEDRKVAIGSYNSVKILDWNTKQTERELKPCKANVIASDFSRDNRLLTCLCDNGVMSIWEVASGKQLKSEKINDNKTPTEVAFSNDGKYLVVGNTNAKESKPQIWDVPTLSIVGILEGHTGSVLSLDFRPDSKQIATSGADAQVMTWNYREIHEPKLTEPEEEKIEETPIPVTTVIPTPISTPPTTVVITPPKKTDIPEIVDLNKLKLTYTHRNIPDSLGERRVTTGKRSFVRREQIEISVWDSETVDGDTISLFFNGEWLLKEYPLRKKKKKINVVVKRNADNYLVLYAHNEGERPPNTAALQIDDGGKIRKVGLSSDMKTCDALKFEFLDN
ncbi:MAG: WD40 repeat domain-containing protein [Chitinophagales bacterium]